VSLYRVKSQLYSDAESQLKGAKQILQRLHLEQSVQQSLTGVAAAPVSPTAADAVIAMKKITGRKDIQGQVR